VRGEQTSRRHAELALVRAAIEAYETEADAEKARFLSTAARGRPEVRPETSRTVELRQGGQAYGVAVRRTAVDRYRVEEDGRRRVVFTGMEVVRRDSTELAKRVQGARAFGFRANPRSLPKSRSVALAADGYGAGLKPEFRKGFVYFDCWVDDARLVNVAVQNWATAWGRKDLNAYFAAYTPGYKGTSTSAAAWQASRRDRIIGKKAIRVELSGVTVEVAQGVAKVSFSQHYAADQLRVTSQKTLELVKQNDKWVIRKESVG